MYFFYTIHLLFILFFKNIKFIHKFTQFDLNIHFVHFIKKYSNAYINCFNVSKSNFEFKLMILYY